MVTGENDFHGFLRTGICRNWRQKRQGSTLKNTVRNVKQELKLALTLIGHRAWGGGLKLCGSLQNKIFLRLPLCPS